MNIKSIFALLILITFSFNTVLAQSLVFNSADSIYINTTSNNSSEEITHKTYVKNVSTDTVNLSWRMDLVDATSGWDLSLCDVTNCLVVNATTMNSFDLAPGDSSELKMGYLLNGIDGSSHTRVKITALGTGEPSIYMAYKADITVDFTDVKDFSTSNFNLYPNPVKNILYFDQGEKGNIERIELFNVIGKKVYSETISNKLSNINVADLENGIYIAKVYTEKNNLVYTQSFIKR